MSDETMPPQPPRKWTVEKRVPGVRWVIRNGERVLQEYWSIESWERFIEVERCVGLHGVWRDVPTEVE